MKLRYHLLIAGGAFVLGMSAYLYGQATSIVSAVPTVITKTVEVLGPPPEKIEVSRQAMLRALEGKLELTTASMRLEKYVPAGVCDSVVWDDCITMLVVGKINAGPSWDTLTSDDITARGDVVTVNIGTLKIHDVVIDHKETKVLEQRDGLFVINPDKTLQMRTIARASEQLRKDACQNGIHKFAALEAEKRLGDKLRMFLQAAGDVRAVKIAYTLPAC